jgi:hypothetical protein
MEAISRIGMDSPLFVPKTGILPKLRWHVCCISADKDGVLQTRLFQEIAKNMFCTMNYLSDFAIPSCRVTMYLYPKFGTTGGFRRATAPFEKAN